MTRQVATATKWRNAFIHTLYMGVLKPIFFLGDPEVVHNSMIRTGSILGTFKVGRLITQSLFGFSDKTLEQTILGIHFKNPIGLAAGFDKNAELLNIISSVGFGFTEVGSITALAFAGNPKPRLWRLPKSHGLVVHFGLKNEGSEKIFDRVEKRIHTIPVGTNIAMTNMVENMDQSHAIEDYKTSFRIFSASGDYFTVNMSCPNTLEGQPFMEADALEALLTELDKIETTKPVFLKMSPDYSMEQVDKLLEVAKNHRVHGIICTNLTKKRNTGKIKDDFASVIGGISGRPVQDASDALVAHIYAWENNRIREKGIVANQNRFVIIGLGGVFSAEDAYKKIRLGANLIQMITGMIFEGPQVVNEINRGLAEMLLRDGFKNISEAVGVDNS